MVLLHRRASAKGAEIDRLKHKLENSEADTEELRLLVEASEKEAAAFREKARNLFEHSTLQGALLSAKQQILDRQTKVIEELVNTNLNLEKELQVGGIPFRVRTVCGFLKITIYVVSG